MPKGDQYKHVEEIGVGHEIPCKQVGVTDLPKHEDEHEPRNTNRRDEKILARKFSTVFQIFHEQARGCPIVSED